MTARSVFMDVGPLRGHRDFRLLFAAHVMSLLGLGIVQVAVSIQVFQLTGSSLQVGLVNLLIGAPTPVFLVIGGLLADRIDRRRMLVLSRSIFMVVPVLLIANAGSAEPRLWPIHVAALASGTISGISAPSLVALIPMLVRKGELAAAGALNAAAVQTGAILGPLAAGMLIAESGLFVTYLSASLLVAATPPLIYCMGPQPPEQAAPDQPAGFAAFLDGLAYLKTNPLIRALLLVDLAAVVFAMPFALFPELANEHYGGGAETTGLLFTLFAFGALTAALTSGWLARTRRAGLVLLTAVFGWGIAIVGLGLAEGLLLAALFLIAAGFMSTVSEILRGALIQAHTPDRLRGRVSSLWLVQTALGPAIGNFQAGAVARLASPAFALVGGGLICLAASTGVAAASSALRKATLSASVTRDGES